MKAKFALPLFIGVVFLQGSAAPDPDASKPKPTPLSEPSLSALIQQLPEEERKWLTEFVAPIILPEERELFLALTEPYQRDAFKLDFWERREQPSLWPPLGPGYRFRYEELRRRADEVYDGWLQDAGRMVLRNGEPASIQKADDCDDQFRDLEIWSYDRGQVPQGTRFLFYRPFVNGPRKMWTLWTPDSDIFVPQACLPNAGKVPTPTQATALGSPHVQFEKLRSACPPPWGPPIPTITTGGCSPCSLECEIYKVYLEIKFRQGSAAGAAAEYAKMFAPARVSTEGLDQMRRKWATISDPKARKITLESPTPVAIVPTTTPAVHRELSHDEILERIQGLEAKYRNWLDLAAPLMTIHELSDFLQLSASEKDRFIADFWRKHS